MGAGARTRSLVRSLGIEHRTIFTGLLRGRDRLEALADADVLVYPSQDEIFGLVPLEALLCGTPVVVADDSGCGEVVRITGGGHVVPLGDVDALSRAIDVVLTSPQDVARAGRRGRSSRQSHLRAARSCARSSKRSTRTSSGEPRPCDRRQLRRAGAQRRRVSSARRSKRSSRRPTGARWKSSSSTIAATTGRACC